MDHLCYFSLVLLCFHACLFVDALWLPAGKGLISLLSFVMSNCDVVTFYIGILGQVWCLIVSISGICSLSYFFTWLFVYLCIYFSFIFDKTIHIKRHRLPPSRLSIHGHMPGICISMFSTVQFITLMQRQVKTS